MGLKSSKPHRSPRLGRPTGRFTQHRRLDKLRGALESNPGGVRLSELATLLHVSTKSIRRYLRELDREIELESVPVDPGGAHVWRIKPSERGRAVLLRRTQAYALLAARSVFDLLKGTALFDELDLALRQMTQLAQRPVRTGAKGEIPSDQRLEDRFLYVPTPPRSTKGREEFDDLFRAVAELRPLRFRYGPSRTGTVLETPENVILHPYALFLHRGEIFFVGLDVDQEKLRAFALDRTFDTKTDESVRFPLPDEFDARDCIHGIFGVSVAEKRVRVVVEFDAQVAAEVRSQKVHPTQRIAMAPDGRVRVSFQVPETESLRRWLLGFGAAARVIEPAELVETIGRAHAAAAARYTSR